MTQHDEGPTQGTHTGDPHRGDPHRSDTGVPHRGPFQGTHAGDPHRGEGPTEDPPPEGRVTQGTHTEHTQTAFTRSLCSSLACSIIWDSLCSAHTIMECKRKERIGMICRRDALLGVPPRAPPRRTHSPHACGRGLSATPGAEARCVCTSVPDARTTDHTRYTQSRFRVRGSAFALWASVSHT